MGCLNVVSSVLVFFLKFFYAVFIGFMDNFSELSFYCGYAVSYSGKEQIERNDLFELHVQSILVL